MASPFLIAGDWRTITFPDGGTLVGRFQTAWIDLLAPGIHPVTTNIHPRTVRAMPISCYERTLLCEVETVRDPSELSVAAFLFGPFGIRIIDGQSATIHDLNDATGVMLNTAEQAAAYCRLFCSAVHGDQGRFEAIEAVEQLGDTPVPDDIKSRVGPITAEAQDDKWRLSTMVRYDGSLFWTEFRLDRDGLIQMTSEDLLGSMEVAATERFEFPYRKLPFTPDGECPA